MCLQTIHYIYATKEEIIGMIAHAMVILSIQVTTVFTLNAVTTPFGAVLNTQS